jgi:translation initiation factor 3 subunit B
MFIEFDNEISAQEAVSQLNGFRLDKSHTFKVNFFSDIDRYQNVSLAPVNEEPAPYRDPGQLMWWLTQPECFDQFCLLYGDIYTSVFLNTHTQPTLLESREVKKKQTNKLYHYYYSFLVN